MKSILVYGSACVDVIIRLSHLPKTEEDLHPQSQSFRLGGCACNVADICGRGGAPVTFVTPVGLRGVYGPFVLRQLEHMPYVSPIRLPEEENGCCYCFVEDGGERTFLSLHGVEYRFAAEWMQPWADTSFDYTYVCGLEVEEATGEALVTWLEGRQTTLLYAPGPRGAIVPPERTRRLLALHPLLHLNEAEALALSDCSALTDALTRLYETTGRPVICTRGPLGALLRDENGLTDIAPAPVAQVADTIGAGDAHAGAVLLALSRGQTLPEAIRFANRVAARVVMTHGARLSEADTTLLLEHGEE